MSICGPALHAIYIIVKCSGEDQRRKGDNAYQYNKIRPGVGPAASLLDASWKATRAMSQANGSNISARNTFHMCVCAWAATSSLGAARQEFPAVSETSSSEEDQEQLHKKLNILKSKIEANIADLPKVLEKMHESVARCKNLENLDVKIHPIFQTRCLYHVWDLLIWHYVVRDWSLAGQPKCWM